VFWAPASTTLGLYQQLCTKRYREIDRNQIRVLEEIGSGQFGNVSKGVWMYKNVSMKVAVKSLNKTAGEGERVKFLQEAAIMGQFYHPNIVRLHGVVTVGNPVLIILDYMPNGDMKSYLDRMVVGSDRRRPADRGPAWRCGRLLC
jgi:serine/threonine protein kinase